MYRKTAFLALSVLASFTLIACHADRAPKELNSGNCDALFAAESALISDAMFETPYTDVDEWRELPVRHRYIHGGFKGTDTKFSFYFPEESKYDGKFFHYITPLPMSETVSQNAQGADDKIGFSLTHGAYFVETNTGGRNQSDATIGAFRANAAAAHYSRILAMQLYESCERPFGYAFGGSGGAFRTIGGMENTSGVWDGAVPFVVGSPMAIPSVFTARMYAMRVLKDKLPQLVDAVEPGAVHGPFDNLTEQEEKALREVTALGFPLQAWYSYKTLDMHGLIVLFPTIQMMDPTYFEDFWTTEGYEGFENPASLQNAIVEYQSPIKNILYPDSIGNSNLAEQFGGKKSRGLADDAFRDLLGDVKEGVPVAIELENIPQHDLLGAEIYIRSGAGKGQKLAVKKFIGNYVILSSDPMVGGDVNVLKNISTGDVVEVNNRNILALQTYHRHQVPAEGYPAWDQFRDDNGKPIYPQRPMLLGPLFTQGASGTIPTGKISGKMIILANLHDTEAYPWQGDWYFNQVKSYLGNDAQNNVRLWYTDHANHNDATKQLMPTHTVGYLGVLQQALLDLSSWVEAGIAPADSSSYQILNSQVIVPESAAERGGIQPVVKLTSARQKRIVIKAGDKVEFSAETQVPEGFGKITAVSWSFSDEAEFTDTPSLAMPLTNEQTFKAEHVFNEPGVYFVTVKVSSERNGITTSKFGQIQNLDRMRVVVE